MSSFSEPVSQPLFADGGEMGERMAAIDWATTPLGPVESWPQSLRTCVRVVLTSRQPMFVWWGDSLINLYNDAYKSILGGKHPAALGQPASEVWKEIWDQVRPRAEMSMRRNQGTYDEALLLIMERHGYPEETYYTFSYSPVPNDQGGTGGIFCANTDDTGRIVGERRIALLRELATHTADARTWDDVCRESAVALATNPRDLPFALVYIAEPGRHELVLAARTGIAPGGRLAPERIADGDACLWPAFDVMRSHATRVVEIDASYATELSAGGWERPPKRVAIVPIGAPGESASAGVLVVGLNPLRPYDSDYATFLDLVSRQIAGAVGNAHAYEAEKRRAEQLAELDRAKTAFFSNVSHEFRTPLTLMLGPVEDALSSTASLGGANLATVHRNALRLLKLVNTLLDFARIEAGRAQASYEPTLLSAITLDLASAFRAAVERAGLRFDVTCDDLPEPVFVDRDMWEKIVLNLLSNAFKFTFDGSITVALRGYGDHVELSVSDTGTGIPEEELPHLFERFHRVKGARSRTHEGSGIGLALVHELVRLHGGTVRVDSTVGRGTTFTVSLPRGSEHLPAERVRATRTLASTAVGTASYVQEALRWLPEDDSEALAMLQLAPPLAIRSGPRDESEADAHILLADDNADMRDYLTRILRERWSVQAVADGESALAAARKRRPDLVLTDVMMPGLDGFGLLRALREDKATRGVPVIMLSARAGEESRVEGLEAGADDYLVKPFSARELMARVTTHLQMSRLRVAADRERHRLTEIFMQAPVPVAIFTGPELRFEVANPSYCAMVGRPALVGKTVREAFPEIGEHEVVLSLERVYRTGVSERVTELLVPIERGGNATEAYFDYIAQPVLGADDHVTSIMVVATEVTAQVMARRHVDSLREVAESANRAKDEFLAMLGHELRNPLAPISTALHLLRLRDSTKSVERERQVIERQVAHLVRLVDDLLDVSRITRGKIELDKKALELATVVASAIEVASPLFEERMHHLDVRVPPRGLLIEADATRLAQVLSNLLTNAAKYTPPGGHVTISAWRESGEVVVSVRDDGVGIRKEMLARVFDTFVQERQATDRAAGGLGLGLAIVRNLVELHGGNVRALSEGPGHGTELVVRLPGIAPAISPGDAIPTAEGRPRAANGATSKRILIVDDNTDAAEMLAEYLTDAGHEVRVAHDGPEALSVAGGFLPEIVLLDIGLPVMDGYEVAKHIRENPRTAQTRLVALTGYGQESDRDRSKQAGFDEHLVKPVSLDAIDRLVTNSRESGPGALPSQTRP